MSTDPGSAFSDDVSSAVGLALSEDVGDGDVTAALVAPDAAITASVLCRESAVLCGVAWFDEVFRQLHPDIAVHWRFADGDAVEADTVVCAVTGPAVPVLSVECTSRNFLQRSAKSSGNRPGSSGS